MAITRRYIISVGEDPDEPDGTIEVQRHQSPTNDFVEIVTETATPPRAPDRVQFALTVAQAVELIQSLHAVLDE